MKKALHTTFLCLAGSLILHPAMGNVAYSQPLTFHSPVVDAAEAGNEKAVFTLIKQGNSIDSRGDFDVTPLMRASYRGNERIVKSLLQLGADANARDIAGTSALHLAARQGQSGIVKLLMQYGADVNARDSEGWTPLMRAALARQPGIVQDLLAHGADAKIENAFGEPALIHAVQADDAQSVRVLVERGGVTKNSPFLQPAIATAARKGNRPMVALLQQVSGNASKGGVVSLNGAEDEVARYEPAVASVPVPVVQAQDAPEESEALRKKKLTEAVRSASVAGTEPKKKDIIALPKFLESEDEGNIVKIDSVAKLKALPYEGLPVIPPREGMTPAEIAAQIEPLPVVTTGKIVVEQKKGKGQERPVRVSSSAVKKDKKNPEKTVQVPKISKPEIQLASARVEQAGQPRLYAIRFGQYKNEEQAQSSWNTLQQRYVTVLRHASFSISAGGRAPNTVYSVTAEGFADKQQAKNMCFNLWRRNINCIVTEASPRAGQAFAAKTAAPSGEKIAIAEAEQEPTALPVGEKMEAPALLVNTDAVLASGRAATEVEKTEAEKEVEAILEANKERLEKENPAGKKAKVEVAEAIPVRKEAPVSDIISSVRQADASKKEGYWMQVGNFPTQKVAIDFVNVIRQNKAIRGHRIRVIKLSREASRNEPAIAIQVGAFASKANAAKLCSAELSYLRCKAVGGSDGQISQ